MRVLLFSQTDSRHAIVKSFKKYESFEVPGFRFEVGGDWFTYLKHYDRAIYTSFSEIANLGDPGYALINVISAKLNLGITGVNLFCAFILITGLFSFLNTLPRPLSVV